MHRPRGGARPRSRNEGCTCNAFLEPAGAFIGRGFESPQDRVRVDPCERDRVLILNICIVTFRVLAVEVTLQRIHVGTVAVPMQPVLCQHWNEPLATESANANGHAITVTWLRRGP